MVPQEAMLAAAKDWRPVGRTGPKEEKWHAAIARNGQMKKLSFSRKFVNEKIMKKKQANRVFIIEPTIYYPVQVRQA